MASILITGGAGFIGTHLCRQLIRAGNEVRVLDLVDPKSRVHGVHYERGDVRIDADVKRMVDGVDAVYHFAAIVSVPVCQEKPIESYDTNLMATGKVLEAIRRESEKRGKKIRMLFAGSSVVYGNLAKKDEPRVEDGPLSWPPSFYGAQKLGSEHAITLFYENYGIPCVVFRFFNVYGPGQDPKSPYSGVISIFTDAMGEAKSMRLNGGGNQTRDFVSVHDVARACAAAVSIPESRCDGKAINLGTGHSITIRGLAEEIMAVTKKSVPLVEAPPRSGDVLHSVADIRRAQEVLGWNPLITLRDGLAELLDVKS